MGLRKRALSRTAAPKHVAPSLTAAPPVHVALQGMLGPEAGRRQARSCVAAVQMMNTNVDSERRAAWIKLVFTTILWGTYATSMKLIFSASGAVLTPVAATTIRFAVMAAVAQFILADRTSTEKSEGESQQQGSFWRNAAELGAWGCAGTQLTAFGLQQLPAVVARGCCGEGFLY